MKFPTAVLSRLRLRTKLIAAMLAAGIVPLVVTGLLAERNARQSLEAQALQQLQSVSAVKRKSIEDYFSTIHHQAATLANNPGVLQALESFTRDFAALEDATLSDDALEQALARQYGEVFAAEYRKQSGRDVDARPFIPASRAARVAQYDYIASNPNALGQKDRLDAASADGAYHATHARYHPALRDFQARFGYYDLFLMDLDGNVVYTVFKELDFGSNLKTGAWRDSALAKVYTAALGSDEPGTTRLVDFAPYTPSYEAPASFVAAPVFSEGRKIGVVALQMPVGRINEIMQTSEGLGDTGETFLLGADGLMRSQSRIDKAPTLLATRLDTAGARAVLRGETGTGHYVDRHGGMVYAAYAPLKLAGLDWALMAEVDEREILAPVHALRWTMAIVTLLAMLALAAFAWVFGSRMSRRVGASVAIARRVAEGHFDNAIRVDAQDEIGDLLQALETMQSELFGRIVREKNEALRVGEALAVASANVMIADNDRNIVFVNRSVRDLFTRIAPDLRKELPAFDPSAVLGRSIDQFHKDPGHQHRLLEGLAGVHTAEVRIGGRILRIVATPVRNESGERLGTVVEWTDLTEQRAAEGQIERAIASAVAGKLDTRLETQALDGFLRTVAEGVNAMLDAIVQPLNEVAATLKQIAEGNIPPAVETEFRGDFTAIKDNLNTCSQVLRTLLEDTSSLADAAVAGKLDTRADLDRHWGDFRRIVKGMNNTLDAIAGPVGETRDVMTELADGNLQRRVDGDYQGEFAVLRESVNTCATNLRDMVRKIRESAQSIGTSSGEISKGNQDLSARTEEQASSLQQTAAAMEELTGTVKQNADNARQANQLAVGARDEAQQGGEVVSQAIAAMGQINESSKRIADIIGVIDEIAFQTNLLALNAAVEAARAGEHGRGFAVVASEVRNLAQRSAVAAKEIKVLIKDSVSKVEDGARLVNDSGTTLTGIVAAVKKVSDIVGEIAAASAEQSVGIEQVNKAIMQMEQVTQQNAALVEQSAAASESMDDEARGLTGLMTFFKMDDTGREPARDVPARVERRSGNRPWSGTKAREAREDPATATPPASLAMAAGSDEVWDEF